MPAAAIQAAKRIADATMAHTMMAMLSGIKAPNSVHRALRVSRQIVQMVVPQGLCSSEKKHQRNGGEHCPAVRCEDRT
jgi:hypothetical protein